MDRSVRRVNIGSRLMVPAGVLACWLATVAPIWAQVNLLPNGSFERRTTNNIPDSWSNAYGGTPTVLSSIATRCGDKVLRLFDSSSSDATGLLSVPIGVTAGESYVAEAYIQRTDTNANLASVYLKYYDATGTNEVGSYSVAAGAVSNVWGYVSRTGAAPATATSARLLCYSSIASTGTMYFDGVSLRRVSAASDQLTRYVAPAGAGTASGADASNPAKYNATAFWDTVTDLLATNAVNVIFLEGDYVINTSADSLNLSYLGNDNHPLTLEGQHPFGSVFTRTDAAQTNDGPAMVHLQWVTNVVLRHLHWENDTLLSDRLVQYCLTINGANTGAETRNVSVQACSFVGLSWNIYGAMGFHHATTHGGQVLNCEFVRGGFSSGFHMIYNAYGAYDLRFENNYFQDCTGSYLRLRGGCHEALVRSNTFVSTVSTYNQPFLQLATFNDVNPGDETFGHNFVITNNLFIYSAFPSSVALNLYHSGFDPYRAPGMLWSYLLTSADATTLTSGSIAERKTLLKDNFGLNWDTQMTLGGNVRQGYHAYDIQLESYSAYGSTNYGGDGKYNISALDTARPPASTNSWLLDANGNWDEPTNWLPAAVPNGIGSMAVLTNNLSAAARTNTLDTAVTLARLRLGSLNGATNFILEASGGSTLTLDNGGAGAELIATTGSASDSISLPIELGDNLTITNTKTLVIRGRVSELGPISGYGQPRSLTKNGSGTLTLTGTNTFSGGVFIKDGMLNAAGKAGLGPITLGDSSGTNSPSLIGSGTYPNAITVAAGSTGTKTLRNAGTSAALTFAGPITLHDDAVVNAGNNTASTTVAGVIDGPGTLTTTCGGTPTTLYVALTGANSFSGGVNLQSGSLRLGHDSALGTGTLSVTSGTLASHNASARILTNPVIVYGNFTIALTSGGTGNLTLGGPVALGSATRTVTVNNTGPNILSGAVSGTASAGLTKAGTGILLLSGGNTYPGDTTVAAGTLSLGAANTIPNGSGKGNVSVTGTLALNGNSETVNGLTGAGVVDGASGTPTLSAGDNNATATFSGVIKNSSGTLALTKVGTGKLTLSGTNSYSGPTTIAAGTLALTAVAGATSLFSNTPAITIAAGARLDVSQVASGFILSAGQRMSGNGTVTGNVTVASGALLAAGNTNETGWLVFNSTLALKGTVLMKIDPAHGTNDAVKGVTSLNYGGTLTVTNLAGTNRLGDTYQLFSATTYVASNFAATNLPALSGGMRWAWSPTNGTLSIVSGIATAPTNLSYGLSGSTLTLGWPASHLGWYAQSNAVSVSDANAWFDIPGSQTATNLQIPMNSALSQVFYRLRGP